MAVWISVVGSLLALAVAGTTTLFQRIQISDAQAFQLQNENAGIYFDWGPDQQSYHAHIDSKPPDPMDQIVSQLRPLTASRKP
jgi:hypothetical protein